MSPMSIIVIAERFGMNKIYKFGDPCGMRREIFMWEKASIKISNTDTFSKKTMLMGKISMDLFETEICMESCLSYFILLEYAE